MTIAHSSTVQLGTATDTITFSSFAVSGTNPALIVKVATRGTGTTVTSVVFNTTETFTEVGTDINGEARSTLFILENPTATTADIVLTMSAADRHVGAASLYTGSANSISVRTGSLGTGNGTNDTPTVNITGTVGDMIVDSMCQVSAGPDTITTQSGTPRSDTAETGGGTDTRGASQELAATGGADTMSYTMSSTDNWAIVGASLQEAAAAAGRIMGSIAGLGGLAGKGGGIAG